MSRTDAELLGIVRRYVKWTTTHLSADESAETTFGALLELEARADERERVGFEWPQSVYDAAVGLLGQSVANRNGRTRKGLDRKIAHALRTWDDKYGPMNPEQAEYAAACLTSCFHLDLELPQVYSKLNLIVHAERVHAGFIRRAGAAPQFDVEALAA